MQPISRAGHKPPGVSFGVFCCVCRLAYPSQAEFLTAATPRANEATLTARVPRPSAAGDRGYENKRPMGREQ